MIMKSAAGITLLLVLITASLSLTANAQNCDEDEMFTELDYWVGDWEVFSTRTGELAGTNVIEKILDGCALFEQWIGEDGYSGTSLTYIDPMSNSWSQLWVDNTGGSQFYWNGTLQNGSVRFDYETVDLNNEEVDGRMLLIRLSATGVRQLNQISSDGGRNWQTLYDLTYIRVN
ncbi:MAG: hypothetical protein EA364_07075 [Balneolaceae bacterium]|nr:MAG: hypothetical protein EA364_07075 [Balneolaceae bacterium]